ncbi:PAS domain S-box protein [Ectothiorhodospiraceae bacterium BW-2]|nr:PAS domain S-box protein [Ectothiorhodospiraceae bacterium BW-2]
MPEQLFNSILNNDPDLLQQFLMQFFNSSFHSIVITTADIDQPQILYANPAFCQMTGYTLEELRGKTPKLFQGPKTNHKVIQRLVANLREDRPFHGSTTNYRKDGSSYPVEWNITPIKERNGNILCYISIQKDLTNLKAVTSRLKSTNEHFRQFLRQISHNNRLDTEEKTTQLLIDNARLFTPALRSEQSIELFEEGEFFDFSIDDSGVLIDNEPKPTLSAEAYISNKDSHYFNPNEIAALLTDIEDTLHSMESFQQTSLTHHIGDDLQDLANTLFFLDEFNDMATTLAELATIIRTKTDIEAEPFLIETFLGLSHDLREWLRAIFIEKTSRNIHEYDATIIASTKQLIFQFL